MLNFELRELAHEGEVGSSNGVAGTVARWVREEKEIIYVVCTNGEKGSGDADVKPEDMAKIREREQLAAAEVLGIREVIFL